MYPGNQKARIHIGKARLGMDDDTYRAFLQRLTGKSSSKAMTTGEHARVLVEMTRLGAFRDARRPPTPPPRPRPGQWHAPRPPGRVHSKDKSSFNRYIKRHFGKNNLADLADDETNTLYNMLEGWLQGATETA